MTTPKTNKAITSPAVRQALAQATLRSRAACRESTAMNRYERRRGNQGFILGAILTAFDSAMRAKGGDQ